MLKRLSPLFSSTLNLNNSFINSFARSTSRVPLKVPSLRFNTNLNYTPSFFYSTTPINTNHTRNSNKMTSEHLQKIDAYQAALMNEECILVDENDNVIGHDSKLNCHLNSNIQKGLLHRAFSVFLFNKEGKLLVQQRSPTKVTFRLNWTNTCCSHPLYYDLELEDKDQIGVKRAAQRKLGHELGIPPSQLPLDAFSCLAKVHYKAESNGKWGEHEVDYILLIQKDVDITPNPEEVADVKWLDKDELYTMIQNAKLGEGKEVGDSGEVYVTPWFKLIVTPSGGDQSLLEKWWSFLGSDLKSLQDLRVQHYV
eukprot:TRINITY_DN2291_c0_g1_i3.p1 TRINITY_DN2291_c0_g1~~TRINITY_DN2291_c0_g1_i3.p1  ORF type:complete len:310 (-),score=57.32 TRINITY_DN2291_c0_g1_i3:67-996(-)